MKKDEGVAALVTRFAGLPDKRVEGRTEHDLVDIVVLALCAVMSGAEDWGRAREGWLRKYLLLRNGIPGHDTIRRVFEALSPVELEERFEQWMADICPAVTGRIIAIDGKALRGSGRAGRGLKIAASSIGLRGRIRSYLRTASLCREIQRNHGH